MEFYGDIPELNVECYGDPVYYACPHCGKLYRFNRVVTASPCNDDEFSDNEEDDWLNKIVRDKDYRNCVDCKYFFSNPDADHIYCCKLKKGMAVRSRICEYFYLDGSLYTLDGYIIGTEYSAHDGVIYPVPTLYEAQKWLREVCGIDVLPIIRQESLPKKDYCCFIYQNSKVVKCKVAYGNDFYECMNDSLFEALKLI